jgi:hypothetical protein
MADFTTTVDAADLEVRCRELSVEATVRAGSVTAGEARELYIAIARCWSALADAVRQMQSRYDTGGLRTPLKAPPAR